MRTPRIRVPVLSDRPLRIVGAVVLALVAAAVVWLVVAVAHVSDDNRKARAERTQLADQVAAQNKALGRANARLQSVGEQPVPVPTPPDDDTSTLLPLVPGPAGPQGPKGDDGRDGKNGVDGDDGGTGPSGTDGRDGADGQDGTGSIGPTGPVGPAGPAGPPGANGKDGQNGQDGKSVTPGTYSCGPGQYVAGLTVGENGGVTLDCQPTIIEPGDTP